MAFSIALINCFLVLNKVFDLRPAAIIDTLGLKDIKYKNLAALGHMGREDLGVSFEQTNKVDELLEAIK